jgi:hypothetical protein
MADPVKDGPPSSWPADAYSEGLGLYLLFVDLPRRECVHLKVLLESYEGAGVIRTALPHYREGRALVALLAVPGFCQQVVAVLADIDDVLLVSASELPPALVELQSSDLLDELRD